MNKKKSLNDSKWPCYEISSVILLVPSDIIVQNGLDEAHHLSVYEEKKSYCRFTTVSTKLEH